MSKPKLKVKTYSIVSRAVEDGVRFGLSRAYKYTSRPDDEIRSQSVIDEVLIALTEVIDFDVD